ncbi:MAG TPA: efflux transporter outer membrane subunit [Sphingomonas sp.]
MTLILAAALSACSLAPRYERPAPPVPASWPVGDAYLRQSEAALPAVTYRDVFRDPRLQALIGQALGSNRSLRVAVANIEAARAQYRIQRSELFPQIDATGRYNYQGGGNGGGAASGGGVNNGGVGVDPTTGNGNGTGGVGNGNVGNGGVGNGGVGNGAGGVQGGGGGNSFFSANVGTTAFEIDLFGRVRSLSRAALDRYFATEAAARATRLILVGDIADAWLTYAADRSLLQIAEATARVAQRSMELTEARRRGGISPRTDVRQAEQILATALADQAAQRTLVAQDLNALTLLVGGLVDPALLPATIEEAGGTIAQLPAGLDSGVLLRRPDVVQAEYELRAANAEIGAARAQLFPRISLTGLVGFASTALTSLFTGDAFNYSVAPAINYPIFQAGAGRANVRFTQAQRDVALASYEQAIQTAFRETADALARQGTLADQLAAVERFTLAAEDTQRLVEARYRGGLDSFLTSLDAQRQLYIARRNLITTRLIGASNRVALYRVLGGDSALEATADGPRAVTP